MPCDNANATPTTPTTSITTNFDTNDEPHLRNVCEIFNLNYALQFFYELKRIILSPFYGNKFKEVERVFF